MYLESAVEFLGTFIFLTAILTQKEPIPIILTLLSMIYLGGNISGGHFNPAVTVMMSMKDPNFQYLFPYVVAQLAGAGTAVCVFKNVLSQ